MPSGKLIQPLNMAYWCLLTVDLPNLRMMIFHTYISLPEAKHHQNYKQDSEKVSWIQGLPRQLDRSWSTSGFVGVGSDFKGHSGMDSWVYPKHITTISPWLLVYIYIFIYTLWFFIIFPHPTQGTQVALLSLSPDMVFITCRSSKGLGEVAPRCPKVWWIGSNNIQRTEPINQKEPKWWKSWKILKCSQLLYFLSPSISCRAFFMVSYVEKNIAAPGAEPMAADKMPL